MYAIINKKTKKFLYGTNHKRYPYSQKTSKSKMLTFETFEEAFIDLKLRECGSCYSICRISVSVDEIIDIRQDTQEEENA